MTSLRFVTRNMFVVAVVLMSCKGEKATPSPFGTLTPVVRETWSHECSTAPVQTDVCALGRDDAECATIRQDHRDAPEARFSIVHRYYCPSPGGWAMWTDRDNQIFRMCIDQSMDAPRSQRVSDVAIERVKDLVTKHFSAALATAWDASTHGADAPRPPEAKTWRGWVKPIGEDPEFDSDRRLGNAFHELPPWAWKACLDVAFDK